MTATVTALLTVQQRRVLEAIRSYAEEHGYPPAIRDLSDATGLAISSVMHQVRQLEAKGWIRRAPGRSRALVVLDPANGAA